MHLHVFNSLIKMKEYLSLSHIRNVIHMWKSFPQQGDKLPEGGSCATCWRRCGRNWAIKIHF